MPFWTLVSVRWHAVLLSMRVKALLERRLCSLGWCFRSHGAPTCSLRSELLQIQSFNMDCVCLWTLILQSWRSLTAQSSLRTAPPETYWLSIRFEHEGCQFSCVFLFRFVFDEADMKRRHCLLVACLTAIWFIQTVFGVTGLFGGCDVSRAALNVFLYTGDALLQINSYYYSL